MRLQNKIGIVTAAASGMGRAGALRFAQEGAAVGVADIDQGRVEAVVAEITAAGGRALALVGDLRQNAFARDIVRRTANAFSGLDFVWNHVGHPGRAAAARCSIPRRPRGWSARSSARSIPWRSSGSSALSARWRSGSRRTRSG